MSTRPAARWLDRVASPARTAGLVAAALLLGAGGALAAAGPDVVLSAATSAGEATVGPGDVPTGSPTDSPAGAASDVSGDEATDDATDDANEPSAVASGSPSDPTVLRPAPTQTGPVPASDDADGSARSAQGPVSCDDARNHGEYVSGVARSVPAGPGHGQAVRAAAQSDCGKSKGQGPGKGLGHGKDRGKGHGKGHRGDS